MTMTTTWGWAAFERPEKLRAIEAGEIDIGDEQVDGAGVEDVVGEVGVGGGFDFVSLAREELLEGLEHDPILVEDQKPWPMG